MNKEEILAMEAGLELDMLVGQYVIGFEDYLKESGKRPVVRDGRYGKNYFDLPNYSSDISAAWEVFTKFDFPIIEKGFDEGDKDYFVCKIGNHRIIAETAPLAICRAALLAVMDS